MAGCMYQTHRAVYEDDNDSFCGKPCGPGAVVCEEHLEKEKTARRTSAEYGLHQISTDLPLAILADPKRGEFLVYWRGREIGSLPGLRLVVPRSGDPKTTSTPATYNVKKQLEWTGLRVDWEE